ncbi:MAG: DUF3343 domain-containing protein [Clostridia bacterium]|nr:DUF3343 domain-containing protein [Clostridia bacterium]
MNNSDLIRQQNAPSAKGHTVAVIGSATYAAKARDALAASAIRADVIKLSASRAHGGCVYGVRFSTAQKPNAAYVLERAGIQIREYMESDK